MEEIIRKYVNCVFKNQKSLKTQSILLLSETLRSDASMFLDYFSQKFDKKTVEAELQTLRDIFDFLEALPSTMKESCMKVKKTQGEDFDFNTAVLFIQKFLIELRSDLDKEEKKECVAKIREVLDDLKDVRKISFERKNDLKFSNLSVEDLEEESDDKKPIQKSDSLRKFTAASSYQQMKGYLQKKNKQKLLKWDERFFSIKNDRLY